MKVIDRLGIVGVGLIGGSLGLAARRAGLAREIVGLGRSRANLDVALDRGIVDRADVDASVLAGADFVVLATPVASLAEQAARAAPYLAPGAVVTDVGSVKVPVIDACTRALAGRAVFVGSHPIAGTEESGAVHARDDLLRGAVCVVTPGTATDATALARVEELWRAVGMQVVRLSAAEHDEILGLTSHLPHLLAFSLVLAANQALRGGASDPWRLAVPSFRDATRVARSSPETWCDILLANRSAIERAVERFSGQLGAFTAALRAGDRAALRVLLERAQAGAASGAARVVGREPRATDMIEVPPARAGLNGPIALPGDKSIGHRALILGALAHGTTEVRGLGQGEDNAATLRVLRGLGVRIEQQSDVVRIRGQGFAGLVPTQATLDCGNSGTTMRLMAGVLAGRPFSSRLDGDESLRGRPMRRVIEPLEEMGARIESRDGKPPLVVRGGGLSGRRFELPVASAQVKTALLLAGLQAEGETTVVEPGDSRDHTERLLPSFGVLVERPAVRAVRVRGPAVLTGCRVDVPRDPSAAAFWLVAASVVPGSRLELRSVSLNPTRTGAVDVLRAMGAHIELRERSSVGHEPVGDMLVEYAPLHGTEVAGAAMLRAIDEFPVLAVAASVAQGESSFRDGAELRVKECDRIAAMARGLASLGVELEERPDGLLVRGGGTLSGGEVDSCGDHRIAMAFAIAALVAAGPVRIQRAGAIRVSDPSFLASLAAARGEGA